MKKEIMSNLIDLDSNTGYSLNRLEDMEGAVMLFDEIIEEMRVDPEAAASLIHYGSTQKKLLAINAVFTSTVAAIQKEIKEAHSIINNIVDTEREENFAHDKR